MRKSESLLLVDNARTTTVIHYSSTHDASLLAHNPSRDSIPMILSPRHNSWNLGFQEANPLTLPILPTGPRTEAE